MPCPHLETMQQMLNYSNRRQLPNQHHQKLPLQITSFEFLLASGGDKPALHHRWISRLVVQHRFVWARDFGVGLQSTFSGKMTAGRFVDARQLWRISPTHRNTVTKRQNAVDSEHQGLSQICCSSPIINSAEHKHFTTSVRIPQFLLLIRFLLSIGYF